jgi:hypothetical protein
MEQNLPSAPPSFPTRARLVLRLLPWGLWLAAACSASRPPAPPRPSGTGSGASPSAGRGADSAPADRAIGPPLIVVDAESAPRNNGDLLRNPEFHQAMDDVRRLRLIAYFQEVRRGLLRVEAGDQFDTGTSVQYNFTRLHSAYSRSIDFYGEAIIEIWQRGRKLGECTRDGLFLGPEYSTPHS